MVRDMKGSDWSAGGPIEGQTGGSDWSVGRTLKGQIEGSDWYNC